MKIYVDFDDCLCETGRIFPGLVTKLFGKHIPYEDLRYFELQKAFSLTEDQYMRMMTEAHRPASLLAIEETKGASETINGWLDRGYDVSIITGRPGSAYEASRTWLDRHGLERARLYCLNKYVGDTFLKNSEFSLTLEDYYKMPFDYAVEDSPTAFQFFEHLPELRVLVYDRPWNQQCVFPGENFSRCFDWDTIRRIVGYRY